MIFCSIKIYVLFSKRSMLWEEEMERSGGEVVGGGGSENENE